MLITGLARLSILLSATTIDTKERLRACTKLFHMIIDHHNLSNYHSIVSSDLLGLGGMIEFWISKQSIHTSTLRGRSIALSGLAYPEFPANKLRCRPSQTSTGRITQSSGVIQSSDILSILPSTAAPFQARIWGLTSLGGGITCTFSIPDTTGVAIACNLENSDNTGEIYKALDNSVTYLLSRAGAIPDICALPPISKTICRYLRIRSSPAARTLLKIATSNGNMLASKGTSML